MWHFTFGDGGLPIKSGNGVAREPGWTWSCGALSLSNRSPANCHCHASGDRPRVIDFAIRFEPHDGIIAPRLDL
jgi:hypothetical protein